MKRIINDLDIKKTSSSEIPRYCFKNVILFWTLTLYVNEALKTGSFPNNQKCANVRRIFKKGPF